MASNDDILSSFHFPHKIQSTEIGRFIEIVILLLLREFFMKFSSLYHLKADAVINNAIVSTMLDSFVSIYVSFSLSEN